MLKYELLQEELPAMIIFVTPEFPQLTQASGVQREIMSKPVICLLVDDDPDDQDLFRYAIQKLGSPITLAVADDGAYALEKLSDPQFIPDVIFMDINMPRLNGLECIAEIKKIDRLSGIPTFIYSTAHEYQNNINMKQLGVDRYLEKPSNVMELIPLLKGIFQQLESTI